MARLLRQQNGVTFLLCPLYALVSPIAHEAIYAIICFMSETIVIDTSVIISALIGKRGPGREIIRRCFLGEYKPLISNTLFSEYEDVSKRKRVIDRCPLSSKEITELLKALYNTCDWIPIYYLWRPNIADEGDNFLIELALAGNATHIITNNIRDLKNAVLKFPELKIVTPANFLRGK